MEVSIIVRSSNCCGESFCHACIAEAMKQHHLISFFHCHLYLAGQNFALRFEMENFSFKKANGDYRILLGEFDDFLEWPTL